MKKILFVVDFIYSGYTTNIKLVNAVAKCLEDRYEVFFLCNAKEKPIHYKNATYFNCEADKSSYEIVNNARRNGGGIVSILLAMIKKPVALINTISSVLFKTSLAEPVFKKEIEAVCKKIDIDAVISVSCPHYIMFALANSDIAAKKISYIMDPYSSNKALTYMVSENKEARFFDNIDHAVVTDLMYDEYKKNRFSKYLCKMSISLFPALSQKPSITLTSNTINCVFVGNIYPHIRDPKYLFEIAGSLDKNIKLNFYGGGYEGFPAGYLDSFVSKLDGRLIINSTVDSNAADKLLSEADILINIGNSVDNQLPSKVIEYMGYCKPILNIYKLDNCPSLRYYEKHPAALSIKEGDFSQKNINAINKFIVSMKGTHIIYNEIESLFTECTPNYVANQFYNIIEDIV